MDRLEFDDVTSELLIEAVKGEPCLWNKGEQSYKDAKKKDVAWAKIAENFAFPAEVCKTRWTHMRDCYSRSFKKLASGSGTSSTTAKYKFCSQMQFLNDILHQRNTTSNFKPTEDAHQTAANEQALPGANSQLSLENTQGLNASPDDNVNMTSSEPSPASTDKNFNFRKSNGNKRKKGKEEKLDDLIMLNLENLQSNKFSDADALFADYLVSEMSKFPAQKKSKVKARLVQVLLEGLIEVEEAVDSLAGTSNSDNQTATQRSFLPKIVFTPMASKMALRIFLAHSKLNSSLVGRRASGRFYSLWRPPWSSDPPTWCSPFGRDAFDRMEREFRRMERDFDGFFGRPRSEFWPRWRLADGSSPLLSQENLYAENPIVREDGKAKFKLLFDVSRFSPEEIDVKTANGKLTVHAKHSSKEKHREAKFEYLREFTIPEHVQVNEMICKYNENGSLVVEAPYNPPEKMPPAQKQDIQIKHE